MSGSFNPRNRTQQRILNYSAQRDETQDFTLNVRNVSGPGPLATANRLQRAGHQPTADPVDHPKHLRPQPRPVAGRRQHQSAAVRRERLPQAQYRAHASHRDPARQHHGLAGDGRVERLDPVRDPGAQWPAHRPGDPGWRVVGRDRRRPRAVQAGEVHCLPSRRTVERVGQELPGATAGRPDFLRDRERRCPEPARPLQSASASSATPTTANTSTNS